MYSEKEAQILHKALEYDNAKNSALSTIKKALNLSEEAYNQLLGRHNTLRSQLIQIEKTIIRDRLSVVQGQINKATDSNMVKMLKDKQTTLHAALEIVNQQEEGGTAKIPTEKLSEFFHEKVWKNKQTLKLLLLEISKRIAKNIAEKIDNTMEADDSNIRIVNKEYNRTAELGISIKLINENNDSQDVTNEVEISGIEAFFLSESNIYIVSSVVTDYIDKLLVETDYVI
jgi:hypothetical protein